MIQYLLLVTHDACCFSHMVNVLGRAVVNPYPVEREVCWVEDVDIHNLLMLEGERFMTQASDKLFSSCRWICEFVAVKYSLTLSTSLLEAC